MPKTLREALFTPAYGEITFQVAKDYHLNEIKSESLMKLVGYVFYGFIHPEELDEKIVADLKISKEVAEEVAEDLNKKIFSQLREEITEIYSPALEGEDQVESIRKPGGSKIGDIEITQDEKLKQKPQRRESILTSPEFAAEEKKRETGDKTKPKEEQPFVIHQESGGGQTQQKEQRVKKSFDFSLGSFFKKEQEKTDDTSAKIRTPFKKDREKTVHYSEYQSMPDYEDENSFINTSAFQSDRNLGEDSDATVNKPKSQIDTTPKQAREDVEESVKKQGEDMKDKEHKKNEDDNNGGPSVEGNTIDLRNL